MSTATQTSTCPLCSQPLSASRSDCPNCGVAAGWLELMRAVQFAQRRVEQWGKEGVVTPKPAQEIANGYQQQLAEMAQLAKSARPVPKDANLPPYNQCWSCETQSEVPPPYCTECGAPWDVPAVRSLRFLTFLCQEIKKHEQAGRLPLAQAHDCLARSREQLAALEKRLEKDRLAAVQPAFAEVAVTAQVAKQPRPRAPRRPLVEILLDPRNIQWLLAFGGALMVLGLVILLWVNKFFTPPVIAVTLGLANAAFLAGGWATIRYSRYQTAGLALTLLACLVMPLNLWYYHSNGLITIDGHLWVAALVISVLYAASALVLRDERFVYVLLGGVTLTGLLILADVPPSPEKFWEIASPSTLLVVLGLLALHSERAFPDQEGPFSRKRFGLAFFWSGHALLAGGLLLVLGAQIAANWLYEPVFKTYYEQWKASPTPVVTELWGQILALCLVVAGTYAYFYSDIVVRRLGVYIYLAAGTLLWAEVLVLELLHLQLGMDALIAVLAVTGLLANLAHAFGPKDTQLTRPLPVLGLFLGLLPVLLGVVVYARALSMDLKSIWATETPTWTYVGAMLLTAVSCRVGAHFTAKTLPKLSVLYFFATAAATLVGVLALLAALGLTQWQQHAPLLMLLPIAYLVAARLYRGTSTEQPLVWVSHAATAVMLISSLASALEGFRAVRAQQSLNLMLACFFAEAAVFYGLAAAWRKQIAAIHLCAAMACATIWQLLTCLGVQSETYTLTFAVVGLLLMIAYRLAVLERFAAAGLANAAFQSGNTLLSLSFVAALFIGLSRLATRDVQWAFVALCMILVLISLLAIALVRDTAWRRWYVVTSVAQAFLAFLAIQVLSTLSTYQKLEIFSVAAGLLLLGVGHIGWYREQERQSDLVSLCLLLGSLLAGVPLMVATLIDRSQDDFILLNEVGFLAISLLLLTTGFLLQLKSTTLTGGALTVLYFLTLLIYVPWSRLNTVAVCIIVGGGLLFSTGLLLSIYRDRLLALPDKIKRREGIFHVLGWR